MDILDELTDLSGAPPHEVKAVAERAIKEIEQLREVLRVIGYGPPNEGEPIELLNQFVDLARAALKETE